MGDGSVILILDPHEIYLLSTSKSMTSNLDKQSQNPAQMKMQANAG